MKYVAPVNYPASQDDPEPAYPSGNPAAGIRGAVPDGKAIEHPMREIMAVIGAASLTPSGSDLTQLLQAINTLIANAGGSGGSGSVSLLYNPAFPEVISNGGIVSVTAAEGSISVDAGQQFIHRGGTLYNSTDTDSGDRTFSTLASKTYHLRWQYNGGTPQYVLKDLADTDYNPTTADETNAGFDTTFDDMLIARVVTDGNNDATVTGLINKDRLAMQAILDGTNGQSLSNNQARFDFSKNYNWARTPAHYAFSPARQDYESGDLDFNIQSLGATPSTLQGNAPVIDVNRYGIAQTVMFDSMSILFMQFTAGA